MGRLIFHQIDKLDANREILARIRMYVDVVAEADKQCLEDGDEPDPIDADAAAEERHWKLGSPVTGVRSTGTFEDWIALDGLEELLRSFLKKHFPGDLPEDGLAIKVTVDSIIPCTDTLTLSIAASFSSHSHLLPVLRGLDRGPRHLASEFRLSQSIALRLSCLERARARWLASVCSYSRYRARVAAFGEKGRCCPGSPVQALEMETENDMGRPPNRGRVSEGYPNHGARARARRSSLSRLRCPNKSLRGASRSH